MVPTVFGLIVTALALYLMRGPASSLLMLVVFLNLFGAASALDLPAIGGSSIQPSHFALLFLVLRLLLSQPGLLPWLIDALRRNIFLVAFSIYGAATAFILPHIFAGTVAVVPLRPPSSANLYAVVPLQFTPQNITAAVYLLGTMIAALAAAIIARRENCAEKLVNVAIAIAWAHAIFGIVGAAFSYLGLSEYFDVVRNASYGQVHQEVAGMKRLAGTFPEPSSYASFGFIWLVFLTELWLRNIHVRRTGPAALALVLVILLSTASTGYASLAGYALLLGIRVMVFPGQISLSKILAIFACMFGGVSLLLVVAVFDSELWTTMSNVFESLTVDKLQSASGLQRAFWVRQGFELFKFSNGLGIGIGSFRSSSLAAAIVGSVGVFGAATFLSHLWRVFRPLTAMPYNLRLRGTEGIGGAAAWVCVAGLIPDMLTAPSADPGLLFGLFSGFALVWHKSPRRVLPSRAIARLASTLRSPPGRG